MSVVSILISTQVSGEIISRATPELAIEGLFRSTFRSLSRDVPSFIEFLSITTLQLWLQFIEKLLQSTNPILDLNNSHRNI